jgi:hypothetical protein
MSTESNVETTKKLCPKGYKVCPKCHGLVKGPRTGVCTKTSDVMGNVYEGCGHVFTPKKETKPTKVTEKTVAVPSEPKAPEVVRGPDPYTVSEMAMVPLGPQGCVIKKAAGSARYPKGLKATLAYLKSLTEPEPFMADNIVVYA